MEIHTREEFEEYMKCKTCNKIMEYIDAEFNIQEKIIILKVGCDNSHKGKRSFSTKNIRDLHQMGIIPDNPYKDINDKYIKAKADYELELEEKKKKEREESAQKHYEEYSNLLLTYIITMENSNLESLKIEFPDENIIEILTKLIRTEKDLTKFFETNRHAIIDFLTRHYQEAIPDYRLFNKFKLFLQIFLSEYKKRDILLNVLYDERIEDCFQYNSDEVFYLTNKRGVIVGKTYMTPEEQSIPGNIPGAGLINKVKSLVPKKQKPLLHINAFPLSKIEKIDLEEVLQKKQDLTEKATEGLGLTSRKTVFSHILKINSHSLFKIEFNVEKEYLSDVWRIFKYMSEKMDKIAKKG